MNQLFKFYYFVVMFNVIGLFNLKLCWNINFGVIPDQSHLKTIYRIEKPWFASKTVLGKVVPQILFFCQSQRDLESRLGLQLA